MNKRISRRDLSALLASAAFAAPTAGCAYADGELGSYRFELGFEIDTPAGSRSASNTIYVTYSRRAGITDAGPRAHTTLAGEAVRIDLDNDKCLFMILALGRTGDTPLNFTALPFAAAWGRGEWGFQDLVNGRVLSGGGQLHAPWIPTIVYFSNKSDPDSAAVLYSTELQEIKRYDAKGEYVTSRWGDPVISTDRFVAELGEGFAFKKAYVANIRKTLGAGNPLGMDREASVTGGNDVIPWWPKGSPIESLRDPRRKTMQRVAKAAGLNQSYGFLFFKRDE